MHSVIQSNLTLCNPMDYSPSFVHGIFQARILEWVAISFSNAWKWEVKVKPLIVSDFQRPHGLQPTRLLRPWDFPGKSTGVGYHCLLCIEPGAPYIAMLSLSHWTTSEVLSISYFLKSEGKVPIMACHILAIYCKLPYTAHTWSVHFTSSFPISGLTTSTSFACWSLQSNQKLPEDRINLYLFLYLEPITFCP